jgi:hypothetical protein
MEDKDGLGNWLEGRESRAALYTQKAGGFVGKVILQGFPFFFFFFLRELLC